MAVHQIFLITPLKLLIYESIEGGIIGSFSWGSMIIISSILGEGLGKEKKSVRWYFFFGGLICLIFGTVTAFFLGISREYISIPYILISIGIASVLYYSLHYIYDLWGVNYGFVEKERIFSAIGKNAFIFYLLHIVIVYIVITIFPTSTSSIIIFPIAIIHAALIWCLAYLLNKSEIFITF
jgi:predicted acyltransferase